MSAAHSAKAGPTWGASTPVSLNSRLESNKEEKDEDEKVIYIYIYIYIYQEDLLGGDGVGRRLDRAERRVQVLHLVLARLRDLQQKDEVG